MSLTILLMLLFSILLLLCGWRNRYYLLFAALAAAMTVAMFTVTAEVSRISNYLVPANYLVRPLETKLYRLIQSILRMPQSRLTLLRNIGVVAYFGGIVCFVLSFSSSVRLDVRRTEKRSRSLLSLIPLIGFPLLYFLFYHPQTAFTFFRLYHSSGRAQSVAGLLGALDTAFSVCVLVYLMWPVLFLCLNYRRQKMTFLSGFLLRIAVSLLLLNIGFYLMFFSGAFRYSIQDVLQYGFWRFTMPIQVPVFFTTLLPFVSFVVLVAVFIILLQLHDDYLLSVFKFRGIRKNLDALYANVRNVMHSEKNLLFTIRILAQSALDAPREEDRKESIDKIVRLCNDNMDNLARTLNDAHSMNVSSIKNDLIKAVEAAVSEQHIPEGITVERHYPAQPACLWFDMYHMTHALGNILSNSVDALQAAAPPSPTIRITVYSSRSWVYLSIWDNGCGIPPKLLHKVEQPYVSTKNKKNSWGIGLSYVFSVVRAHYGQMHIRSRQNEYTQVEILLPAYARRR